MLSCAAIQKLERYGHLGLKRNSVEDFVASSLKDVKRTNIYSLTHAQTWQECLNAIHASSGSGNTGEGSAPVMISDALIYAVSFASSLVTRHLFDRQQSQTRATRKQQQKEKASDAPAVFPEAAPVAAAGRASEAAVLIALLKRVLVQITREGNRTAATATATVGKDGSPSAAGGKIGGVRIADSKQFAQSLTHLLSNVAALLFYAVSIRLNGLAATTGGGEEDDVAAAAIGDEAQCIWNDGLVLLAAATRLLRRSSAAHNGGTNNSSNISGTGGDDALFTAHTANALVKQFLAKQKNVASSGGCDAAAAVASAGAAAAALLDAFPLLRVVLDYTNVMAASAASGAPMAGGFALFENFTMLQKMSLLHGLLPDVSRLRTSLHNNSNSSDDTNALLLGGGPAAFVEASTEQLLRDLLSTTACNKATRYVIYFRGDDLKLMQSKVTHPSQYALHTFATTPPVEPSVVDGFMEAMQGTTTTIGEAATAGPKGKGVTRSNSSGLPAEQQRCFYALLFAQWIVSAPFFFEAFCTYPSWTAFAQEQRRTALLRQAHDRKGRRREDKRKRKRNGSNSNSSGNSAAGSEINSLSGGDDNSSIRGGDLDSIAPSLEMSRSMLSLESRASLLSTLSKQSAATYMSFLSILRPTDGATAVEAARFHESADGNTNLPLILLEELVLALHRFMEAFPPGLLDRLGLRSLCWQSIGRLFLFIQDSISGDGSLALTGGSTNDATATAAAAAKAKASASSANGGGAPLTIFNLGTDLRYNHGLGYESLGLLFAKVIAPQFEAGQQQEQVKNEKKVEKSDNGNEKKKDPFPATTATTTVGRASLVKADVPATKRCVEAALSSCLSAYEEVAPQVVDMNLPVILRIAARTAAEATTATANNNGSNKGYDDPAAVDVLYQFLAGIVVRLGKCNQVTVLLDALVASPHAAASTDKEENNKASAAANGNEESTDGGDEEREDVAALNLVFSHPLCRDALVRASAYSMDPENLLGHLLTYVSDWSLTGSDKGNEKHQRDPHHIVFVLKLVATILEGLHPTSMTSSAVLERSTELEMLLTAFARKHLIVLPTTGDDGSGEASLTFFAGGPLRTKLRRQLWLHVLYAVYRCRSVTVACLRDLGLQNVRDYLELLNDSLWRVDSSVGALLLLGEDEEEEVGDEEEGGVATRKKCPGSFGALGGMGFDDLAGEMAATTRMALPPHVHIRTLLPALALQRLSLARSVSTVLGCAVAPAADARHLAHCILDAIAGCCSARPAAAAAAADEPAAAMVLAFVNDISEEEWSSLVKYAKKKQLRATLVTLFQTTFASAASASGCGNSNSNGAAYVAPVWLLRCLRSAVGPVLRAMTDMFLSYGTDDITQLAASSSAESRQLLAMIAALECTYAATGHLPYWPLLADRASEWITALLPVPAGAGATTTTGAVMAALLSLLRRMLSYESKSGDVTRRTLLLTEAAAASVSRSADNQQRGAGGAKGLSRLFLEQVGVLAKEKEKDGDDDEEEEAKPMAFLDDELAAFGDELTAFAGRAFTKEYVADLLRIGTADAAGVLAFLYHTAVLATRQASREGRYYTPGVGPAQCRAARFVRDVADAFAASSSSDACLDLFLRALGRLPMGDAALTAGLPRRSSKKQQRKGGSAAEAVVVAAVPSADEDVTAHVNAMESVWLSLLRTYMAVATTTTTATTLSEQPLRCLVALYDRLLASHTRAVATTTTTTTATTTAAAAGGNDEESASAAAAVSFALLLLHSGDGLLASLRGLFAPATAATVTSAVTTLFDILLCRDAAATSDGNVVDASSPACGVGMTAVWVLYNLHAASLEHESKDADKASRAAEAATATALVAAVLTHLPLLFAAADTTARKALVAATVTAFSTVTLPLSIRRNGRLPESAFTTASGLALAPATVAFFKHALGATVGSLALLRATAAPPLMHSYLHALLSAATATALTAGCAKSILHPRPSLSTSASVSVSASVVLAYELLTAAAAATLRLTRMPGVAAESAVRPHVLRLLTVSTAPELLLASSSSPLSSSEGGLYGLLLALLQTPCVAAVLADDVSVDAAWACVALLVEESNSGSKRCSTTAAAAVVVTTTSTTTAAAANTTVPTPQAFALSQSDIMSLLSLLARCWLPTGILWRRAAQLPPLINAVFEAVLIGVRDGAYERRVLNQVSSFFHQLVRLGGGAAVEETEDDLLTIGQQRAGKKANTGVDDDGSSSGDDDYDGSSSDDDSSDDEDDESDDDDVEEGSRRKRSRHESAAKGKKGAGAAAKGKHGARRLKAARANAASSPSAAASHQTRLLCLAATVAGMFQLSRHYVPVFTTHSNDLDFIARDFLKALSRQHLPRTKAAPIAFHRGVSIRPAEPSMATFADLVYTCVGDEECKALLRQAAMRLDEEEVEQGGGGAWEGLVERRHIFNVDA